MDYLSMGNVPLGHFVLKILLSLFVLIFTESAVFAQQTDVSFTDVNGSVHKLSDYRGKWVVVNYWATWCPPCLEEIPELVLFHEGHKDKDAIVLGVNFEDIPTQELKNFIEENFVLYPVFVTKPNSEGAFGAILGLPTTYIISPQGALVAQSVGPVTVKSIESYISNGKK